MAWEGIFDPFDALGLERNATPTTIKSRYQELARRYHPNRNQGSDATTAALSAHFHHVHQAWQHLCDPDKRRRCLQRLELEDLHESVLAGVADLLYSDVQQEHHIEHHDVVPDGHISSDADDDDLPRIAGLRRRQTFDRPPKRSTGLEDISEASDSSEQRPRTQQNSRSRFSQVRNSTDTGKNGDQSGDNENTAAERRKRFDKLRRKELKLFNQYHDAMTRKFAAEEAAERCEEQYERAKWRREYYERAPKETSQRVRLMKLLSTAAKALTTHQPARKRQRSTVSLASPVVAAGESQQGDQFLSLPSRNKSVHRRGYSSDISGDQTSSDENEQSSEKATSPSRSPRPSSPRPTHGRHRRWDSVPNIVTVGQHCLPNGGHDPISPILGPGPKLFVRAPTNLHEMSAFDVDGSDADSASASASSRSPSPQPTMAGPGRFVVVQPQRTSELLISSDDRRSRSPGPDRRALNGSTSSFHPPATDACQFQSKEIGQLQHRNIPIENVHFLTYEEKQWLLNVEPDTDVDPATLLIRLSKLDKAASTMFMVKPDIKEKFNFRLIYSHREVAKHKHQTFIALSYRRKLHVEKKHNHYSLPLEPEMFQAVWDERLSDTEGVWIDQICIGETNEEKTISMSAMDMVYRSARLVVVALDDVELEAHEGSLLESHMAEFERQVHVPTNKRFRRRQTPYLESHDDLYIVLRKMLRSSWFRRAWCRHEMRLAREHIFLVPVSTRSGRSVLRFTGKCLTHFLGLATEVPFEQSIEAVKPALYAFFRDRSKLPAHEHGLRSHHGNFTTVVAEVFAMEAGGDPRIPEEARAADARKDKLSIILNTMECGLATSFKMRDPRLLVPEHECNFMLLLLALAARDPGALCSVGRPLRPLPYNLSSSWLLEPTNVDSGLNNYRTLNRLPGSSRITTHYQDGEHFVQLALKFLKPGRAQHPRESPDAFALAQKFMDVCESRKVGRNRKRYLIADTALNAAFGSMRDVYIETLACVFECGPEWMSDVCERYGVSRWKHDLDSAYQLMIALKNTDGRWPDSAWSHQATGFIMDFVNFLIIRGLPQRQMTQQELWRPVWVSNPEGGKVVTFAPPGNVKVAVPMALLDPDYIHLARLWVLQPRHELEEETLAHHNEWILLGKSVLFSDDISTDLLEIDNGMNRAGQKVFGRPSPTTMHPLRRRQLRP
ncbi:hypothetical protein LTR37_009266 [Vermiconidia calcicola]|uniref:Uncharacterized protein n=1 Tax=Vermiconidia calcicola TaxID=1690605 RepID=A0ACC3N9S3_9PEZI|nr:hypothetical protein LTR37_009266 [Vermiconidia calcicola]